ncbi:MAG: hypothetical protein LBJ77_00580 [Holosporales bacterium]|nr:hypothetical protein [Holosporales bacterium]
MRLPETTNKSYKLGEVVDEAQCKLAEVFRSYEHKLTSDLFLKHFDEVEAALVKLTHSYEKKFVVQDFLASSLGRYAGCDFTDSLINDYECYKELLGVTEELSDIEYDEDHNPIAYRLAGSEFDDLD